MLVLISSRFAVKKKKKKKKQKVAKRKKRGKEKKKKTDDNDGDGDNCSEYITLLQKYKREKIQKKKGLLFYKK